MVTRYPVQAALEPAQADPVTAAKVAAWCGDAVTAVRVLPRYLDVIAVYSGSSAER
jgi:hypothetical protein